MRIAHIAIWANDLEAMKDFYMKYFEMECSEQYHNPKKQFTSYFLSFIGEATAIELMQRPDILPFPIEKGFVNGLTHFAISVGSKNAVDRLTERIETDGHRVVSDPRITGDGFYESVVEDADGNWVEITE